MGSYTLKCAHPSCGMSYENDSSYRLLCDGEQQGQHGPAFLRAVYPTRQLTRHEHLPGIFPYSDWLPTHDSVVDLGELGRPFCLRSERLAGRLGLGNLYIAFSGYWPPSGERRLTCTFKEFECQASIARYLACYPQRERPPLIVASAGNTGNSYSVLTTLIGLPMFLIVPESALRYLVLPYKTKARVLVVRGDYSDAIRMAEQLTPVLGAQSDGGSRNVARRAGMATAYLHAVTYPRQGAGALYDHYFQAIGSGAGAIAAWEAVLLLLEDGRFGATRTQIHIGQNEPFTPICDAWSASSPTILPASLEYAGLRIAAVTAKVLANRTPSYSIAGGLFDVLKSSQGSAWKVSNTELFEAARLFREMEGTDIGPESAVALASLMKAVAAGKVRAYDRVLLHVTGGGDETQREGVQMYQAQPEGWVDPDQLDQAVKLLSNTWGTCPCPLSQQSCLSLPPATRFSRKDG